MSNAATPDTETAEEDRLPDGILEQMPELILDSFRKMLWVLEVDGMYGLEADGCHATGYLRCSLDDLLATPGQYIPLARDHRPRTTTGLPAQTSGEGHGTGTSA